jgi:hypothetical protein
LAPEATLSGRRLKIYHRASAVVLALFIFLHLLNHLSLAAGHDVHLLVMSGLRAIYRWLPFEFILLAAVVTQIMTGARLATPRLSGMIKRRDWQLISGLYMSAFLTIHVTAILSGRFILGLDTNLWFGAAGFHVWPWQFFFVPYYGLAILAFFTHMGFVMQRIFGIAAVKPAIGFGIVVAGLVLMLMSGLVHQLPVPENYLTTYR